ncbi:MAG: hypothetical protein ACRD2G_09790, partial [Terriglobia bacterium]
MEDDGRFLYSRITSATGLVRYYYLPQPFRVLPSLTLGEPVLAANQGAQLAIHGVPGQYVRVLVSTNLATWSLLTNFTAADIPTVVQDRVATGFSNRFYRAIELDLTPPYPIVSAYSP